MTGSSAQPNGLDRDPSAEVSEEEENENKQGDGEHEMIVNELLSFVSFKLNWMPPETIVQLCSNFYSDEAVETAKTMLYNLCADASDKQDRHIKRTGPNKKKSNLEDIVGLLARKCALPVTFVAKNLSNLPAVTFNNIDVSTLLSRMETMRTEMDLMRSTVSAQATVCADLQTVVGNTVTQQRELQDTVSGIVANNMSKVISADNNAADQKENTPVSQSTHVNTTEKQVLVNKSNLAAGLTVALPPVTKSYAAVTSSNEEPGWQVVNRQRKTTLVSPLSRSSGRRGNGSAIIGKAKGVSIKAAKPIQRLASVFVSRLDPNLTSADLKTYLVSNLGLQNIEVQLVRGTESHSSFHVTCKCDTPRVFLTETLWPEGAYVRWWRERKETTEDKKTVCKFYARGSDCYYGHTCRFLHEAPHEHEGASEEMARVNVESEVRPRPSTASEEDINP